MVIKILEKRFSLLYPFRTASTRDRQCSGAGATEYTIIASVVAAAILAALSTVSTDVRELFMTISNWMFTASRIR
jgi:Flp pilus assembly pilin Flp